MNSTERPALDEIVDVVLSNRRVVMAVYNPKWENAFQVCGTQEALTMKPLAWRPRSRHPLIKQQRASSNDAEYQSEVVNNVG